MNIHERQRRDMIRARVDPGAPFGDQAFRFGEEVDRFEADTGSSFYEVVKGAIHKSKLYRLECGLFDLRTELKKSPAWFFLTSMGFDLGYVFWGDTYEERQRNRVAEGKRRLSEQG